MHINACPNFLNSLIRYPMEVGQLRYRPEPREKISDFKFIQHSVDKYCSRYMERWLLEREPVLHPGRVFVGPETYACLGRRNLLVFLNYYTRGGWEGGAVGWDEHQYEFEEGRDLWSYYTLPFGPLLWIRTNRFRTCTVMRLDFDTLKSRRAYAAQFPTEGR